ncbi:hypothetical protein MMC18_001105 [Xylographa bjoerkii]|nr:hypothetical protein [Xylographa bjoerkii]
MSRPSYSRPSVDSPPTTFTVTSEQSPTCRSKSSEQNHMTPKQLRRSSSPRHRQLLTTQRHIDLRYKAYRSRLRLKERRNELREETATSSEINARLAGLIQASWEQGRLPDNLEFEKVYQELQVNRDELGVLQYEYDQAEEEHEILEEKLDLEEERLVARQIDESAIESGDGLNVRRRSTSSSSVPTASFVSESIILRTNILEQYQSRVGDGNIMWERLQDMIQISQDKKRLYQATKPANSELGSISLNELQEIFSACSKAKADLEAIANDVNSLRARAETAGVQITTPIWLNTPQILLHSNPIPMTLQATSPAPTQRGNNILPSLRRNIHCVRARINKWFLQKLESSGLERLRHRATLQAIQGNTTNQETWAISLLKFWDLDEPVEDLQSDSGAECERRTLESWAFVTHLEILISSAASKAVHDFDIQFAASEVPPSRPGRHKVRRRSIPYSMDTLDFDILSMYESRSI